MVRLSIAPFEAAYQTNSPALPRLAAPEETLTMAPPAPPRAVDMRRTASRAQRKAPSTLMRKTASSVAADTSATRPIGPLIPALLTSPVSGPSAVAASNIRSTSASTATSP